MLTRTRCVDAQRGADALAARARRRRAATRTRCARARWSTPPGPGPAQFLREHGAPAATRKSLRLVKGSHIVVPQLFDARPRLHLPEPRQADHLRDPLRGRLHADRHHRRRAPRRARRRRASTPARSPTCASRRAATSRSPVAPADVVWTYSGVRPLLDDESGDPSAVTRDYLLELDTDGGAAAVRLGRQDHDLSQARRGGGRRARPRCSASAAAGVDRAARFLPGGDLQRLDRHGAAARHRLRALRAGAARSATPGCRAHCCRALARAYGARIEQRARRAAAGSAPRSRPACTRPSCDYLHDARMGAQRRRRAVAPQQARPAPERRPSAHAVAAGATRTGRRAGARARGTEARMELTLERIEQQVGAADLPVPARPDAGAAAR